MRIPGRPTRHLILFLFLSLIALTQTSWWIIFQVRTTHQWRALQTQSWSLQSSSLTSLLHSASPHQEEELQQLLLNYPDLELEPGSSRVRIKPQASTDLADETSGRIRMFVSEGIFFVLLLLVGISYMYWTLRRERIVDQLHSSFLAATSHELRTPITSLRLMLETLALRSLPAAQYQEFIGRMQLDLERLHDQIDSLLHTQSILKEEQRFELVTIPISEVTLTVCQEMASLFQQKQLTFVFRIAPGLQVRGDEDRWQLVVKNLLDNAFKYTDQGRVTVELSRVGERVQLRIEDEGSGFTHSEGRRLFNRFYRSESPARKRTRGTGLGLYLVRRFVEAFAGEVKAFSHGPGKGALFTVTLPCANSAERSDSEF